MTTNVERDAVTGVDTTGHEWDGIRELNNPLPRWWLWTFWACCIWAVGYWIVMPAWPLVSSHTRGVIGYSSRAELARTLDAAEAAHAGQLARIRESSLEQIVGDPPLMGLALSGGRSAFDVNCSQCHGLGAAGGRGFPSLIDDSWLWGGTQEAILQTIRYGIRADNDDTRFNQMPAFGVDGLLERDQIRDVVEHVLALSGQAHDAAAAARGTAVFADNCVACHGEDGKGNQELGAPDLTDAIWLYGGDRAALLHTVSRSRNGMMPAWEGRLDEATLKQLALYVHSLGGGQ